MTVTYSSEMADDVSRVRFWLRDTSEGSGPLPGDANFADSEIEQLIELEGSWQRAVAAGFEALASAWSRHPTFSSGDLSISRSDVARRFAEQAAVWREKHGSSGTAVAIGVASMTREDGYSEGMTGGTEYV